jgi:hypothetical protein
MQEISEQYFRKDCGAAARNIFPNNHTHRILSSESQQLSAVALYAAEAARVENPGNSGTIADLQESAAHLQSNECRDCIGRGEDAHGSICRACGGSASGKRTVQKISLQQSRQQYQGSPGHSLIPLNHGKFAIIDNEDFAYLSQWKWTLSNTGYAKRAQHLWVRQGRRKSITILMHREVASTPKGKTTDHKNHITLDNRKENLRVCSKSENACNLKRTDKGIRKCGKRWSARIRKDGKEYHLGMFDTKENASEAYANAAVKLHGEFACFSTGVVLS